MNEGDHIIHTTTVVEYISRSEVRVRPLYRIEKRIRDYNQAHDLLPYYFGMCCDPEHTGNAMNRVQSE